MVRLSKSMKLNLELQLQSCSRRFCYPIGLRMVAGSNKLYILEGQSKGARVQSRPRCLCVDDDWPLNLGAHILLKRYRDTVAKVHCCNLHSKCIWGEGDITTNSRKLCLGPNLIEHDDVQQVSPRPSPGLYSEVLSTAPRRNHPECGTDTAIYIKKTLSCS